MSEEKQVEAVVTIEADADTVWRAITEGEELKRWFSPDARVTPGVGGGMWMSWGEGMDWETPITVWEPSRHLRTEDPAPSKVAVDYYIEAKGGETVVRVVQSGFAADAWDDEVETARNGWRSFMGTLRNYLERHRGEPRTLVYVRHPVVKQERKEVFSRMLEALGLPLMAVGEKFEGPVFNGMTEVSSPPINFSGPLDGGGYLMVEIEPGRGRCRPAVWVSLYGEAAAEAAALQQQLEERVTRAFAASLQD